METQEVDAAITQANELLKNETPFKRHEKDTYSKAVQRAYESIRNARTDGFSFQQICAAFEKAGLLPNKALPNSFRQAFYREVKRQKKSGELAKRITDYAEAEKNEKKNTPSPIEPERKKPEALPESGRKETDDERIKRMTSVTVNTGNGKVIKHADGSFEF